MNSKELCTYISRIGKRTLNLFDCSDCLAEFFFFSARGVNNKNLFSLKIKQAALGLKQEAGEPLAFVDLVSYGGS